MMHCRLVFACWMVCFAWIGLADAALAKSKANTPPDWVNDPYIKHPQARFLAATGQGDTIEQAKQNALTSIAQVFGVELASSYRESRSIEQTDEAQAGATTTTAIDTTLSAITRQMLQGAVITATWQADNAQVYAHATLRKQVIKRLVLHEFKPIARQLVDQWQAFEKADANRESLSAYDGMQQMIAIDSLHTLLQRHDELLALLIAADIPFQATAKAPSLDQLQAAGRTVGVISHMPELAERIGFQVRVEPKQPGLSHVYTAAE